MTAPLVFLDTETTGLHADRRPWEIAMIRRNPDGEENAVTILIDDVDVSSAELIGLNIGGFFDRHHLYQAGMKVDLDVWQGDPGFPGVPQAKDVWNCAERDAAKVVAIWTRGAHIVGAVPNFDTETLAAMLRRHGLCPAWHYHLIDVEALAIGWMNGLGAHGHSSATCMDSPVDCDVATLFGLPWKSDDISRACGVEPPTDEERHTAMGDARWAMRLYDRIAGAVTE